MPANAAELANLNKYRAYGRDKKDRRQPMALDTSKPVLLQHFLITYDMLARQLEVPLAADGKRNGELEFAVMAYDFDGVLLNAVRSAVHETIPPERYQHMQDAGYQLLQRVGIPVAAATLRIGVRDALTQHIGSTELHLPLKAEK